MVCFITINSSSGTHARHSFVQQVMTNQTSRKPNITRWFLKWLEVKWVGRTIGWTMPTVLSKFSCWITLLASNLRSFRPPLLFFDNKSPRDRTLCPTKPEDCAIQVGQSTTAILPLRKKLVPLDVLHFLALQTLEVS